MASELDKWAKRHCFPVDLGDGVKGYVKPMTFKQMRIDETFDANQRTVWYLACCVCDETGTALIQQNSDEDIAAFLLRAADVVGDWDSTVIKSAMDAITKIISPTDTDTLVKN